MNDGKVEKFAKDRLPAMGGEIAATFKPNWNALEQWNGASVGAALSYWYLGDKKLEDAKLGSAIAPYVFMEVPLLKKPHFELGLRPGFGCSFITKTYRNTVPEGHMFKDLVDANQSVGSVFNFYFPEALYMRVPIRQWSIHLAGGWYHMSNGSIRQPNSGYNIFAAELGVSYTPSEKDFVPHEKQADVREKNWEVEAAFAAGGRQVYYKDQQSFFTSEIQLAAYWRAHNIFRLGGGVDLFYDGAYVNRETKFGKTELQLARPSDCWRLGLSVQPEFVVGHFTAGFHVGVYLLDGVKNLEASTSEERATLASGNRLNKPIFYKYDLLKAGSAGNPDGWLYTQIVMRYKLPYHIFIQATMKAHLTKVEFVSAGLGCYF